MRYVRNLNIFHFLDCFACVNREDGGVLAHESVKTSCFISRLRWLAKLLIETKVSISIYAGDKR